MYENPTRLFAIQFFKINLNLRAYFCAAIYQINPAVYQFYENPPGLFVVQFFKIKLNWRAYFCAATPRNVLVFYEFMAVYYEFVFSYAPYLPSLLFLECWKYLLMLQRYSFFLSACVYNSISIRVLLISVSLIPDCNL